MKARERKRILLKLRHIDAFLKKLHQYSRHISKKEEFLTDEPTQIIVSKLIEDTFEAIRVICRDIRPQIKKEYSKIEWEGLVTIRHQIAHESFQYEIDSLYDTMIVDIHNLERELPKFMKYVLSQKK